jgi:hypothetical protein
VKFRAAVLVIATGIPAFAQYAGPAILSRGEAPTAMAAPQIDFRPFVSVGFTYSTGLAGVAVVDNQGDLANTSSSGEFLSAGVSGVHSWRHTHLGLDYSANYTHYNTKTFYDYINQSLGLGLTHQVSRHVQFGLRQSMGMFSRVNPSLGLSQTVPFDQSTSYIPTTDFYDNRTIYSTTQGDLVFQKSSRLSFSMGGDFFTTIRRSKALYGTFGLGAMGDMQYRVSRRSTLGLAYTYNYFHYTHILSSANFQGLSLTYGIRLSRLWEFSGYGGGARVETKFLQTVPIDPNIAAFLGITSATVINYRVFYVPNFAARLSRTFHRGVAYVAGGETITPGNGLFLTSRSLGVNGGYGYTGLRRWSVGANVSYARSISEANIVGQYGSVSGSASASREFARNFHFTASVLGTKYQSPTFNRYNRVIYSASIGIGWSPGDVPLRVW